MPELDPTSQFPATAIDTFPVLDDTSDEDDEGKEHDLLENFHSNAIVALQTKVGLDSSSDTNSIDYKLTALAAVVAGLVSGSSPVLKVTSLTATGGETSIVLQATPFGDILILKNGVYEAPLSISGLVYSISAATGGDIYTVIQSCASGTSDPGLSDLVAEAITAWPKLAAWWELDETSGSTFHDSHTGGFDMTTFGSPTMNQATLRSGGVHSALFGSTTYAEVMTGPNFFGLTSGHSVTAWVKPTANPDNPGGIAPVAWNWNASSNDTGFALWLDASNNLKANWTNGAANQFITDSGSVLASNSTHFIGYSAVYGSTKEITFYQDGAISSGPTGFSNNQAGGSDKRVMVGALDNFNGTYYFVGYLQGVAIWNDYLTAAEHAYLYNGGAGVSYAEFKSNSGH